MFAGAPSVLMDNYVWEEKAIAIVRTDKEIQTDVIIASNGFTSGENAAVVIEHQNRGEIPVFYHYDKIPHVKSDPNPL